MNIQKIYSDLSNQGKIIFNVAMFFVVIAVVDRTAIGPLLSKQRDIEENISTQEIRITRDLRFLSYRDNIEKEVMLYDKFLVDSLKSEDDVNSQFSSTLQRFATDSNVNLIKSDIVDKMENDDYTTYVANVDCNGDLKDIIAFMHVVGASTNMLKIDKFNMSSKRGSSNDVNLSVSISKMIMEKKSSKM